MPNDLEHPKLAAARRRVEAETGFYIHAAIYVAVMSLLLVLNILLGSTWWVQWPLIGWGIGLALHAWLVFSTLSKSLANWQEKRARELAGKM